MRNKKKAAAVKYLKEKLEVPVIAAYGTDDFADKIIKEAEKNGIEIVSNENFFKYEKQFSIEGEIPEEVYKIVADIIACIIKTNKRGL